jgi:glycosyltransferase involved in cell wall biosynthesis
MNHPKIDINEGLRILMVNTLYHPYLVGGAEISVQALAEKYVHFGHEVAVLTLGEEEGELELNSVTIWRLKISNVFWPFKKEEKSKIRKLQWHIRDTYNVSYSKRIEEINASFKPDIVHTNNLSGFSVAVWKCIKKNNIKIVHTLRDYYLLCPKTTRFKDGRICQRSCLDCSLLSLNKRSITNQVDMVVGISNYILNLHTERGLFEKSKRQMIYNGFDIPNMSHKQRTFDKGDDIKFGFIGQINEAKGVKLFLKSLSKYQKLSNWTLTIAGRIEEGYKKELQFYLPHDKLDFIGFSSQDAFFDKIDVLVVPSIWEEPFGRVVLEAMLRQKVVLASKRGGLQELMKNNEKFLFEPNENELSRFLGRILSNPLMLNDFVIEKSQIDKYSLNATAKKYLETFYKLLN